MTSITLNVTGAKVQAAVNGPLTSGMVGIPVTIRYDDAWSGLTKNLVCRCGKWGPDKGETRTVLNISESVTVAHEVMQADMHLYLGIEGYSADGKLVIPTTWADCGVILHGANAGEDLSADPKLSVWAQLQAEIDQIKQDTVTEEDIAAVVAAYLEENPVEIPDSSLTTDGLSDTAKTLLISILRNGAYSTDQSANITALEVALLSGDGDGDGTETVTYTVTNILTNVASSNAAGSVAENAAYSATLTAADGYELDTVTVTMGGVDISSTACNGGVVTIAAVTGNVVITATAVKTREDAPASGWTYDSSKWLIGYAINASTGELESNAGSAVYDEWIKKPTSVVLTVTTTTFFRVRGYDENKEFVKAYNSVTVNSSNNFQAAVDTTHEYVKVVVAADAIKTNDINTIVSNLEVNF